MARRCGTARKCPEVPQGRGCDPKSAQMAPHLTRLPLEILPLEPRGSPIRPGPALFLAGVGYLDRLPPLAHLTVSLRRNRLSQPAQGRQPAWGEAGAGGREGGAAMPTYAVLNGPTDRPGSGPTPSRS